MVLFPLLTFSGKIDSGKNFPVTIYATTITTSDNLISADFALIP
jgi:hypothetical protein